LGGERETRIVGGPGFGRLRYENVLPGADLVFYGTRSGELEFDVVLHPGAAPEQVELVLDGCVGLDINERGEAVVEVSGGGTLTKLPPFAY
jgi:hypothetical protein